jgi:hypothetical protein
MGLFCVVSVVVSLVHQFVQRTFLFFFLTLFILMSCRSVHGQSLWLCDFPLSHDVLPVHTGESLWFCDLVMIDRCSCLFLPLMTCDCFCVISQLASF